MSAIVHRASEWMYRGLWRVLGDLFLVPHDPPTLPVRPGEAIDSFQPGEGFLRYLKFWFWFLLVFFDLIFAAAYAGIAATLCTKGLWWVSAILLPPTLFIIVVPDIFAYIAIHLRYDTTWYVMTDRSLRIRRGIWAIHEVTITYENIQNIRVRSGPVQRYFGIADVMVETAGGGGAHAGKGGQNTTGHQGVIEGVGNAIEIRDRIMAHLKQSQTAGLGDDRDHVAAATSWTPAHMEALRAIRDEIRKTKLAIDG